MANLSCQLDTSSKHEISFIQLVWVYQKHMTLDKRCRMTCSPILDFKTYILHWNKPLHKQITPKEIWKRLFEKNALLKCWLLILTHKSTKSRMKAWHCCLHFIPITLLHFGWRKQISHWSKSVVNWNYPQKPTLLHRHHFYSQWQRLPMRVRFYSGVEMILL